MNHSKVVFERVVRKSVNVPHTILSRSFSTLFC